MIPYLPSPAAVTAYRYAPNVTATTGQLAEAAMVSEMLGCSIKRALVLVLTMDRAEISVPKEVPRAQR